jgi:hypothetical protein
MGKTKSELEALAARYGWEKRALTLADVRAMKSDELEFHSVFNADSLNAALEGRRQEPVMLSREKQFQIAERLFAEYPQLIRSNSNAQIIDGYLREITNPKFQYSEMVEAFEKGVTSGRLQLDPSAIGVSNETSITGYALKTHPKLDKLILPAIKKKKSAVYDTMSADEYLRLHPEAKIKLPPSQATVNAVQQHINTFLQNNPSFIHSDENEAALRGWLADRDLSLNFNNLQGAFEALVADGMAFDKSKLRRHTGSTWIVGEPRGTSPYSGLTRESLKNKVKNMTSREYETKYRSEKSFREAVDALG